MATPNPIIAKARFQKTFLVGQGRRTFGALFAGAKMTHWGFGSCSNQDRRTEWHAVYRNIRPRAGPKSIEKIRPGGEPTIREVSLN
jgi:hypothetical protein